MNNVLVIIPIIGARNEEDLPFVMLIIFWHGREPMNQVSSNNNNITPPSLLLNLISIPALALQDQRQRTNELQEDVSQN